MKNRPDWIVVNKSLFPVLFAILCPLLGNAQYANSWINFSQQYYRVPVARDGIYRLTYNDLQTANVPVGSIDPRFIQLFHRGVEQAIISLAIEFQVVSGVELCIGLALNKDGLLFAAMK